MRIRSSIAVLISSIVFLPSAVLASNGGWYVAADTTQTRFDGLTGQAPLWFASVVSTTNPVASGYIVESTNPGSYHDSDSGYRLVAGYRLNPYLGIEAGFVDLGHASASEDVVTAPISISCGLPCENAFNINAMLDTRGWIMLVTATYPWADHWELYAHAGFVDIRSQVDIHTMPINNPPYGDAAIPPDTSITRTNFTNSYGFGLKWLLSGHWGVHLAWDKYLSLEDGMSGKYSAATTSLGIEYLF